MDILHFPAPCRDVAVGFTLALMKSVVHRCLRFAVVPLVLAVMSDLLLWVFYQGGPKTGWSDPEVVVHATVFLAVFILAALGSFFPFFVCRRIEIRARAVLLGGMLFAVATFFVSMPAFAFGGPFGLGIWLLLGAALFAAGTCKWGRADAG